MTDHTAETFDVLIVDDDVRFLRSVVPLLVRMDRRLKIRTAHSIQSALRWLEETIPDVLVTELEFPHGSGAELIREMRKKDPQMPVIVASYDSGQAESATAGMSGTSVIGKPFFANTLQAMIFDALTTQSVSDSLDDENTELGTNVGARPDCFTGAMSGLSMVDVVQFNVMTGKRRALHIHEPDKDEHGWIFFDRGRVVHSLVGNLTGREAFFHLLSWERGNFLPWEYEEIQEETISGDPGHLILEALTALDEIRAGNRSEPDPEPSGEVDLSTVSFSGDINLNGLLERERLITSQLTEAQPRWDEPDAADTAANAAPWDGAANILDPGLASEVMPDRICSAVVSTLKEAERELVGFVGAALFDRAGYCQVQHVGGSGQVADDACPPFAQGLHGLNRATEMMGLGATKELMSTTESGTFFLLKVGRERYLVIATSDLAGNAGMLRMIVNRTRGKIDKIVRRFESR